MEPELPARLAALVLAELRELTRGPRGLEQAGAFGAQPREQELPEPQVPALSPQARAWPAE
jgi:hypothetical protein